MGGIWTTNLDFYIGERGFVILIYCHLIHTTTIVRLKQLIEELSENNGFYDFNGQIRLKVRMKCLILGHDANLRLGKTLIFFKRNCFVTTTMALP